MKLSKTVLISFVAKEIKKLTALKVEAKKKTDSFQKKMQEKYNYPIDRSISILNNNIALETLADEELFWIVDILSPTSIEKYFDSKEINKYSKSKYKVKSLTLDDIPCIEVVRNTQWIGVLEDAASFFQQLRKHNMINYNPDAQREMTVKKLYNGQSIYTISLDKRALESMRERYRSGNFISNTITLNIDPYGKSDVEYDPYDKVLRFKKLDHFDIIDGFHRYRALCEEKDLNPDFTYPMEIRFTKFGETKASDFIYQEGQKVPMRKSTLDSFDANSAESKIIKYMTDEMSGFLSTKGIVGRSNAYIFTTDLNTAIKEIWVTDIKREIKSDTQFYVKRIAKEISQGFNSFEDMDREKLGDKLSPRIVYFIVACIKYHIPEEKWIDGALEFDKKLKRKTVSFRTKKVFEETFAEIVER